MSEEEKAMHWTLDRRIPVALIMVLLAQGATAIWWASNQASRVERLERDAIVAAARLQAVETRQGAVEAFGERIDERTSTLIDAMRRVEAAIARIAPQHGGGGK